MVNIIMIENLIVIPYRDRQTHLEYFINNIWPLIENNVKSPYLLIVEQSDDGKLFNRGKLLNIGGDLYKDKCNYIITHDVDTYTTKIEGFELYNNIDYEAFGIFTSHKCSLGGITKLKIEKFIEINGFPNDIWGWGIEDRALFYRSKIYNLNLKLNNKKKYFNFLTHKSNAIKYINEKKIKSDLENEVFKKYKKEDQIKHIRNSGLNNLEYKIIQDTNLKENIRHIIVNI